MAFVSNMRNKAATDAIKKHRGKKGSASKTDPGDEDFTGHADQDSHTRPGEKDFTGHKGDESKTRVGEEDYEAHKGTESKTHSGEDFEPPDLKDFYGKGPGKNYIKPGGDPYSYRLYDDGSIEIIAGPSGIGTILSEGRIHDAIKESLTLETSDEPGTEESVSMSEQIEEPDAAMASLEGTLPNYIADEEHLGQLREGFEESLPQEALAEQRTLDQITGMGPDRSKSLYALAEKLLGTPRK